MGRDDVTCPRCDCDGGVWHPYCEEHNPYCAIRGHYLCEQCGHQWEETADPEEVGVPDCPCDDPVSVDAWAHKYGGRP